MFKSVLIAEDQQSMNISVRKTLDELGVQRPGIAYYCDDAFTLLRNEPAFDLLITDLFFSPDQRQQKLKDGWALIDAAKVLRPYLKILVFSHEHRPVIIRQLFEINHIDGFVCKGRGDADKLKKAIQTLAENKLYKPEELRELDRQKNLHTFTDYDLVIIGLLAQGVSQKDMPFLLEKRGIKPSGMSSIEKRLILIRTAYRFSKNEQLIAYCKDIGLI